jgi:hypothetical protein
MTTHKVKWARAPEFAEAAEALGIRTNQIAALMQTADAHAVLWTTDDAPDDACYTELARDHYNVLRPASETRILEGYFADLWRRLDG